MAVVSIPTAGNYPIRFNKREAKVIETATQASGNLENKIIETSSYFADATDNTKILAIDLSESTAAKTVTLTPLSDVNSELKFNFTGSTTAKYASLAFAISADRVYTFPDASDTLVGKATTDTFTNKTFDADGTGNVLSNVEDANIKAAAAIAVNKLASVTASKALVSDASGFISASAVTSTQIGYLSGLGGTLTTGGAWTQTGAHTIGITTTSNTAITLPTSGTLAVQSGDSFDDVVDLKLRDVTTVAYTLELESNGDGGTVMSADRKVIFDVFNADRNIDLQGNVAIGANFTTSGNACQIVGGIASVSTLPNGTDTIVGRASTDTLTNKTLTSPTLTSPVINTGVSGTAIVDEDNMVSDSATKIPTQQSVKAYVDGVFTRSEGLVNEDFTRSPAWVVGNGVNGIGTGTAGDVNALVTRKNNFEFSVLGTQTTVGMPWKSGSGIEFIQDQTDNDGCEITQGIAAATNPTVKVVGTDNARFTCKYVVDNVTGTDTLVVGWRKVEAYNADYTAYGDYAGINLDITDLVIVGENDGAAGLGASGAETATLDTTQNATNAQNVEVRVTVGDEALLQTGMRVANAAKVSFNAHIADFGAAGEEHLADHGSISAANASDTTTLFALVAAMLTKYAEHNDDAINLSPTYHQAAGTDYSLTSDAAPTTLAECMARLNDLVIKLNDHYADNVSHSAGDTALMSEVTLMCNTYFELGLNDGALAECTATAAFNFDDTDQIIPFFYFLHANGAQLSTGSYLKSWKVEDLVTV